jgi:hypothetical protein
MPPIVDPPPTRPEYAFPSDVKAYAQWLDRQVDALNLAVQAFVQNPLQPFDQRQAVDFVVTVGRGISWNRWVLGWKYLLSQNGLLILPQLPIPLSLPEFTWDTIQAKQVELEGWRSEFKSRGVPVPEPTELPNKGKPPLDSVETIAIAGAVIVGAGLVAYLVHRFA